MGMLIWNSAVTIFFSATILCGASSLARVPLSFEPGVRKSEFVAHAGAWNAVVTPAGAAIGKSWMRLVGARAGATAVPETLLPSYTNYLIGEHRREWRTHVANHSRVRYSNIYPGIDVVYYGKPGELEFDFLIAPGADPRRIRLALSSPNLQIRLPRIYQGDRSIKGHTVRHRNHVTFEVDRYDRSRPLVIDPVLSFATMLGGGLNDGGVGIAVDASGATYVIGSTLSGNFPAVNAVQAHVNGFTGATHVFVSKINAAGTALVYSTYLGGSRLDFAGAIAVDRAGAAYVTGQTNSPDFPVAGASPMQPTLGGDFDVFVAKLSPDGSALTYASFIGGSGGDNGKGIAVDGEDAAYITGQTKSANFPLVNPLQHAGSGSSDAFVVKLDSAGAPVYSTYLGGRNEDIATAIAVDRSGAAYVTGSTNSTDFPVSSGAQSSLAGLHDAFLAKLSADGSALVYSTLLGGNGEDESRAIAVDSSGAAYIAGQTGSGDFPLAGSPLQSLLGSALVFKTENGAASWKRSDTGMGGNPSILAVDPANPSKIYAVAGGELYVSRDSGATWSPTGNNRIVALAVHPSDSRTLFAADVSGAILRSTDGGVFFDRVFTGAGRITALVVDPKNPLNVYAGSSQGGPMDGLIKSADGGATWKPTALHGAGAAVFALAIAPSRPSTLYVTNSSRRVLSKSDDGGEHFVDFGNFSSPGFLFTTIVVDPVEADIVYGISNGAIWKSTDGGRSFSRRGAFASASALEVDPIYTSIVYAATQDGVLKSVDGGDSWQPFNGGLTNLPAVSLAIDPQKPATLYAGTQLNPDAFVAKLNPDGGMVYSTYLGAAGADSANAIAVDAAGNAYIAGGAGSPDFPARTGFRDFDGKADGFVAKLNGDGSALIWSSFLGGGTPAGIALGTGETVYLTGSSGVRRFSSPGAQGLTTGTVFHSSDGGANWDSNLVGASFTGLAIDPRTPARVFARASFGGMYWTADGGATWSPLAIPVPVVTSHVIDPQNPSIIYIASSVFVNGSVSGIFKSTDGGASWAPANSGLNTQVSNLAFPFGLAIDPKTPSTLYAATSTGVLKSTDSAGTWKASGLTTPVQIVVVDPVNTSTLYAAMGFNALGLQRSRDGGATWTSINNGLPSNLFIRALVADPATSGTVYLAGSAGLYKTTNGGDTWTLMQNGLPSGPPDVLSLAIDPANPSILYAGSASGGLYRSMDRGGSWTLTPLAVPVVTAIAIDPTNSSRLYAGTMVNESDAFVVKVVE